MEWGGPWITWTTAHPLHPTEGVCRSFIQTVTVLRCTIILSRQQTFSNWTDVGRCFIIPLMFPDAWALHRSGFFYSFSDCESISAVHPHSPAQSHLTTAHLTAYINAVSLNSLLLCSYCLVACSSNKCGKIISSLWGGLKSFSSVIWLSGFPDLPVNHKCLTGHFLSAPKRRSTVTWP